jgi:Fur family ferric uptake transcriptional regulator
MAHPHSHPEQSETPLEERVSKLLDRCREVGLRRTHALQTILRLLVTTQKPLTTSEIVESEEMAESCDLATVYRLLTRLKAKGIVRRLGLHERSAHFALRVPNSHDDYLICTECGTIEQLEMECPVEPLEAEVARQSGFRNLDHELEFFGVCPDCANEEPLKG